MSDTVPWQVYGYRELDVIDVTSEACMFYIMRFFTMADAAGEGMVLRWDNYDWKWEKKPGVALGDHSLRLVCKGMLENVTNYPWRDRVGWMDDATWSEDLDAPPSLIRGSVALWRKCFPYALSANLGWRRDVVDADLEHLRGVRHVNISGCTSLTDSGFLHLAGVRELNMPFCDQPTITDLALQRIAGVERL